MSILIQAENISKKYDQLQVLKDVSLSINKAEVVCIVGPSGAGKTTLLQILGTLDKPDAGKVRINDTDVFTLSDAKISAFRNQKMGFVFQFHKLLPEFTAIENVCIPALIGGLSKTEAEKKALELLEILGIAARKDHKPKELSGGEQQRVAVARALINNPLVVFADEPSGNLDSNNANELHQLFFKLRDRFQQSFVIVTHNKDFSAMADRTFNMVDGAFNEIVSARV
jgi:lipoprotein-releasing system ATP-binding protein